MKLATIRLHDKQTVALVEPERGRVWPIGDLLPGPVSSAAADMVEIIARLAQASSGLTPCGEGIPLSEVEVGAPIPNPPRNIMCVGKNYREHAHEFTRSGFDTSATSAADAIPEYPIIFSKPCTSISGPEADIPMIDGLDAAIDYEVELAVVVGKGGRGIRRENAMEHVFGYTIVNDVTARDLQARHKQWLLGKGIDGFCPMGPWIVTRDELDLQSTRVRCRVNGELRQDASTAALIFDVPTLIETISLGMTLVPGDIIATGTPQGVGIGFNPPRFLGDGDVVECEISGIGTLRNTVRRHRLGAVA
jgi:2-keto-4-pentenoate hydratase/2-oxohepta-3-ene-1,7-dioic acid hydratase in catechol pathway